jgi:hypothetical protein
MNMKIKFTLWLDWVLEKKFLLISIGIILALGLALRLMDLQDAPLDFFPARQLRSAIIARGMYYAMLPPSSPALDSSVRQAAIAMWHAEEVYEPQIFERLVATGYWLMKGEHLWLARVLDAIFALVGGLAIFDLSRRMTSNFGGLISLAIYLLIPFGITASRSFQPEPFMIMGLALTANVAYRWGEAVRVKRHEWRWALWVGILGGITVLIKIVAALPVAGLVAGVALTTVGLRRLFRSKQLWLIGALLVAIPYVYYFILIGERSGGFFTFWTVSMRNLLIQPSFYLKWWEELGSLFGFVVLGLDLIGICLASRQGRGLLVGLWLGYFIYGLILPLQISTHTYYSLILLPMVALSVAPLAGPLLNPLVHQSRLWAAGFAFLALGMIVYSAWLSRNVLITDDYTNEVNAWTSMGQALPENGSIIALAQDYGKRLSYYGFKSVATWPYRSDMNLTLIRGGNLDTNFPQFFSGLTQGYRYFLITYFGEYDAQPQLKTTLNDHYPMVQQGDGYILFDLSQRK